MNLDKGKSTDSPDEGAGAAKQGPDSDTKKRCSSGLRRANTTMFVVELSVKDMAKAREGLSELSVKDTEPKFEKALSELSVEDPNVEEALSVSDPNSKKVQRFGKLSRYTVQRFGLGDADSNHKAAKKAKSEPPEATMTLSLPDTNSEDLGDLEDELFKMME